MQDFRKEAKMGAIMKIVRKFAKEYQDGYEEELTKIARIYGRGRSRII